MERAAEACEKKRNPTIEIEHVLQEILESEDNDISVILHSEGVEIANVLRSLQLICEGFHDGTSAHPRLSPLLVELLTDSWLLGSIEFKAEAIRSGHIFAAYLRRGEYCFALKDACPSLRQIEFSVVSGRLLSLLERSKESKGAAFVRLAPKHEDAPSDGNSTYPTLDRFTLNLTDAAKNDKIDPVLGRDSDIDKIIDILMRRRQNNPILTGEAGVGKTAVVEGFAQRVARGDVPTALRQVQVRSLDLGRLQAGASVKGEFEDRLKNLISEIKAAPDPVILFIDEAHTMIGAGGTPGQNDAANLLKPALARGELRTIAATTWAEYARYFEKDAALARRFQVIKIEEPSTAQAIVMVRGLTDMLEQHHGVPIRDEAVESAVLLSHRYLSGRQMPDKCVSVLDTACARVAATHSGLPNELRACTQELEVISAELTALERGINQGRGSQNGRTAFLQTRKDLLIQKSAELNSRWANEQILARKVLDLRAPPIGGESSKPGEHSTTPDGTDQLLIAEKELREHQGKSPMIRLDVDARAIAEVISDWTNIPLGRVAINELQSLLDLPALLHSRIIGQSHAISEIASRLQTAGSGIENPDKPKGVFLLVGPSGVGKTETAMAIAETLYGGEKSLITINMSEYQEGHSVSGLKGPPPGYIGYGEGGVLTEAVRRRPYSVLLLDEMEKAHQKVQELFYSVFDKGILEDTEGRQISFKECVILMTSNAADRAIGDACMTGVSTLDTITRTILPVLRNTFADAFLGRCVVVPYYPLSEEHLRQIAVMKLDQVKSRLKERHQIELQIANSVVNHLASKCAESPIGARSVENLLNGIILPEISRRILSSGAESGSRLSRVKVSINRGEVRLRCS